MAEPTHKKRYANSPKIEKDAESGKPTVTRGEKAAAKDAAGLEGVPEHEKFTMEVAQRQAMERLDLHHKHEREHTELAQKYAAPAGEAKPAPGKDDGGKAPAAEKPEKKKE